MTYQTLKEAVLAVEENNDINGAKWSDWQDAGDIAEVYEIEALTADEIAILERAIESNGKTLADDLARVELAEYGQNFGGGGHWITTIRERYAAA